MSCIIVVQFLFALTYARSFAFDVRYKNNATEMCLSLDYNFRYFIKIHPMNCVKECSIRPKCRAVNYHRTFQLCELLSQDFGDISNHAPPCVLIKKSDMLVTLPTYCDQCNERQTCSINEIGGNGTCENNECKPVNLTNGHTLGSMHVLGSRIVYVCEYGYRRSTDVHFSVCLPDGTWSDEPDCIPDPLPLDFCPGVVLDDGRTYQFGTLNSTFNFGDYCDGVDIFCNENGVWGSIPNCGRPVIALYLGCYLDCNDRLLDSFLSKQAFNPRTTENCIVICSTKGYKFAYTEASDWCYCGNEVFHFTSVDDSECNTPCKDNTDQMCGGKWRLSLYDLTVQTGSYGIIRDEHHCTTNGSCIAGCSYPDAIDIS